MLKAQLDECRQRCEWLETIDPMTGMKNCSAADRYLHECAQNNVDSLSVFIVDIDGLRAFNNRWGYRKGNELIGCFGKAVLECQPGWSFAARISGGQYWFLCSGQKESERSETGCRILNAVRNLNLNALLHIEEDVRPTVSVGSSCWDGSTSLNADLLIMNAGAALDEAKQNGGDQHIDYQEEQTLFSRLRTDTATQQEIEKLMYPALENGGFFPVYQPQYDNLTGQMCCAELLARWRHPQKGLLFPADFLPLFEKNRFIIDLDMFMFEQACQTLRKWLDENKPAVPLSCNFSGQHFVNPFWVSQLVERTKHYRISPAYIEIELSESTLIEYKDKLAERIKELREKGFVVAVDHFGTGYASLGLLQDMPVDAVKLDRSLLQKNLDKADNRLFLSGILYMAKMMHLQVLAVGVENKEQEAILQKNGCHIAQGNYYGGSMSLEELEQLLSENYSCRKPEETVVYGTEHERDFAEMILQEFYVGRSIEPILEYVSPDVTWTDIFHDGTVYGRDALRDYLNEEIKRHSFLFNLYSCTVRRDKASVAMSGEGVLTEQEEEKLLDRRFCFFIVCEENGGKLRLLQFRMTAIIGDVAVNARRLEIAMCRDAEVRHNQAVLEELYGVLPIGIIRYHASEDMVITYINDHMLHIIGYTREEFFHGEIGGNIRLVVYPDDLELNYTMAYEMMLHPETPPFTFRYIRKDGKVVRVLYQQCMVSGAMGAQEVQSMIYEIPDNYEESMRR